MGRKNVDITSSEVVKYIIQNGKSIREAASYFNISKSTIQRLVKKYNGEYKEQLDSAMKKNVENSRFKRKE